MVSSNVRPEEFVVGVNSTVINYNITERTSEDGTVYYTYGSMEYPTTDMEALVRMKTKLDKADSKELARTKIRSLKDIEDDLTDQKKLIQFMARGFAGLWTSLPQEIKDANPYKDNFDTFSSLIVNNDFRLDLETDQVAKITKILNDEAAFAEIVNEEYLSKIN